jgi:DTW domain-containing protein YfiP
MALPLAAQRLIAKASDFAEPLLATEANDVLPCLISLDHVYREAIKLFRSFSVLVYLPHTDKSI